MKKIILIMLLFCLPVMGEEWIPTTFYVKTDHNGNCPEMMECKPYFSGTTSHCFTGTSLSSLCDNYCECIQYKKVEKKKIKPKPKIEIWCVRLKSGLVAQGQISNDGLFYPYISGVSGVGYDISELSRWKCE